VTAKAELRVVGTPAHWQHSRDALIGRRGLLLLLAMQFLHRFFLGPTLYAKFADRWQLTAAWSIQIAGQTTGSSSSLDLTNFVRYEARFRVVSEF
jgi:hypothetical protein